MTCAIAVQAGSLRAVSQHPIIGEVFGGTGMSLEPITRIHRGQDGFVTFHLIRDDHVVNDCAVKVSELSGIFPQFVGELEKDFYFSLNSFYRPGQPDTGILRHPRALRRAKTARYLNLMYVDIDHYKLGIESGTMAGYLFNMQDRGLIPPMSLIIRSGRGMWALWMLVDQHDGTMRPPTAHSHRQLLWRAVERELIRRFADYKVDRQVCDVSRIARVPGTVHGKSNLRVEFVWLTSSGRWRTHTMEEMAAFLDVPLPNKKPPCTSVEGPASRHAAMRAVEAASMRLYDFLLLLDMRGNGLDDGCRNFGCVTYAWLLRSCRYDSQTIERETAALGLNCRPALSDGEIKAAIAGGKQIEKMRDVTIAECLEISDEEARAIPRFYRGGLPPRVKPITVDAFARRCHVRDILASSQKRLSCSDIRTALLWRGIAVDKATVIRDMNLIRGQWIPRSRPPEQLLLLGKIMHRKL